VGLICISLIISDVEHLLMCLLAVCMSSFKIVSIHVFCPFLIGLFVTFLVLSCMNSLYILDINPLSDISFTNLFPFGGLCFCFVGGFLHCAKALLF